MKNRLALVGMVAGLAAGGIVGVALGVPGTSGAQTPPSTPAATTPGAAPTAPGPGGSNEEATHEAGESAGREADEAAGKFGGGGHHGGGSNEDATHESGESAAREAAEDAGKTAPAATPAAPAAAASNN